MAETERQKLLVLAPKVAAVVAKGIFVIVQSRGRVSGGSLLAVNAGAEMAGVYEKAIDVISRIQQNVK